MDHVPTPAEVKQLVHPLTELDRKVLGGLVALFMAEPDRIRDREWTAQHFVQVATVAHGFEASERAGDEAAATPEDVARIRAYAEQNFEPVTRVAFAMFVRVAHDMQSREAGFTLENAQAALRSYLE